MKLRPLSKPAVKVIVTALALLIIHFFGAQLGFIGLMTERFLPHLVSAQSFKRVVMHPESGDAYSAYNILGERRSTVARKIAIVHLNSKDDYLWMNAAQYLGDIGDPASVPYLIKALRHTASRSDSERREVLVKLTGKDYGTDFTKWQDWWLSQHPDSQIDWESHLGSQPRLYQRPQRQTAMRHDPTP
jgi:hypothetical protein